MMSARAVLGTSATADEIRPHPPRSGGRAERALGTVRAVEQLASCRIRSAGALLASDSPDVEKASDLLEKSGVKDTEFAMFQRNVRADIDHGADPTVAAQTRARGLLQRGATTGKPSQ